MTPRDAALAFALPLRADHLIDLQRSGLTEETLRAAGVRSLTPAEWSRYLSAALAARVQSCYAIPYPDADDFYRVKLVPPVPDGDGHVIRYFQPAGTAPRLYLPPRARAALADPSVPMLVTEGEKKSLRADQEGLACIAIGGLWSWLLGGQPIPDLDRVDWCERETLITPDSDVWTRPDLLQAVYALGKELEARGAKVTVLKLPAGANAAKTGLDDFLCAHPVAGLHALPRLDLKHSVFTRTADWWKAWRKRKADDEKGEDAPGAAIMLADPEEWPDPVDGARLLDDMVALIRRYVIVTPQAADAAALWTLHTYAEAAATVSPILVLSSPTRRCGKTHLLAVLGSLARRPLPVANITAAALFRTVERFAPTLLVDEADTFLRDSEELRGIVNAGHFRATAFVVRTIGDDHEPRAFSTWGPKAIALIGRLPDTLEDRSIVLSMRRRAKAERVERLRLDRLHVEARPLQRQALRWVSDSFGVIRGTDPEALGELNDRQNDNWRPLLALADAAGGAWPRRVREAARALSSAQGDDQAAGVLLLQDLQVLFEQTGADRLATATVIDGLVKLEGRPWSEWSRGRPLSPRGLARLLEPFDIRPRKLRIGTLTPWGYPVEDCQDAFLRYLSPSYPEHPEQVNDHEGLDRESHPEHSGRVPDRKQDVSACEQTNVLDVPDRTPPEEPEWVRE